MSRCLICSSEHFSAKLKSTAALEATVSLIGIIKGRGDICSLKGFLLPCRLNPVSDKKSPSVVWIILLLPGKWPNFTRMG